MDLKTLPITQRAVTPESYLDEMGLMLAIVELSRGHRESKRKSDLIAPVWRRRKDSAREGGIVTERLPAWVEARCGKLRLIRPAADAVRRVFKLAAAGHGMRRIVARLTKDEIPPIGTSSVWTKSCIAKLLRDRRCLGDYQPRKGRDRVPMARLGPCLVIPFFGRDFVSLKFGWLRPDNPRTTKNEDGEEDEVKYEQPKDELIRLYFPPLVGPLLDDPGLPLVITEGEKKACAVVQAGLPCVGLAGVWCWHDTSESAKGKGRRTKRKTLHPDVKAAITKGRRVLVGFDTPDTATNPDVQKAERSLLNALRKAGAVATTTSR